MISRFFFLVGAVRVDVVGCYGGEVFGSAVVRLVFRFDGLR